MITVERLREVLNYEPDTGVFSWNKKPRSAKHGAAVGGFDGKGYWRIGVDGVRYSAHRLAWLYVHGRFPSDEIDHINGIRTDNRIENLREASRTQNIANNAIRKDNKTGLKGVTFYPITGRWMAKIQVNGKRMSLGYYPSPEEAHWVYCAAAQLVHGSYAKGKMV